MSKTIWNWARTAHCRPTELAQPRDEAELAALVARCTTDGRTLRVIGAGHSWNAAAMSDDVLVRLDQLSGIRSIDGTRVRVGAGTSIYTLNRLLHERGLALSNLGSIGVMIGGISGLAPERRSDFARFGFRSMIGGALAAFMTAAIAGMLI